MLVSKLFGARNTSSSDADRPSLRDRLRGWWIAHELDQPWFIKGTDAKAARAPGDRGSPVSPSTAASPPEDRWTPQRLKIAEMIWGSGFNFPGGTDYVLALVKPFALTPQKSMLDMGSGLGGAARAIAKGLDTRVSGLEASPKAAAAGMEMSERQGLGKRAPIGSFDPDSIVLPARKYDCAFVRQVLCPVVDKPRLLGQLKNTLKPHGHLLITEYVIREVGLASAPLEAWRKAEERPPRPWTIDELRRAVEACNFEVRIAEDISAEFSGQVREGWASVANSLSGGTVDPDDAKALVSEVELWTLRMAALESGDLCLVRLFAIKRD